MTIFLEVASSRSLEKRRLLDEEVAEGANPLDGSPLSSPSPSPPPYKRQRRSEDPLQGLKSSQLKPGSVTLVKKISDILGGDHWLEQEIGSFGPISTISHNCLGALKKAVEKAVRTSNASTRTPGRFPQRLVDALIEAGEERKSNSSSRKSYLGHNLGQKDYERASKLLGSSVSRKGEYIGCKEGDLWSKSA